jgi:hypothetical protein
VTAARAFAWRRALKQPGHGLTPTELLVLLVLELWAGGSGCAWPSVPTIAAVAGVSERTVRKALARAEALGWIEAPEDRPGGARAATVRRQLAVPTPVPGDRGAAAAGAPPLSGETSLPLSPETGLPLSGETPEEVQGKRPVEEEEIAGAISCAAGRGASKSAGPGQGRRDGRPEAAL